MSGSSRRSDLQIVTITSGCEVISALSEWVAKADVTSAAIVSVVGAVGSATVSNMAPDDEMIDYPTNVVEPMELSGCGEIVDGSPHLHVVLSGGGGATVAGHLVSAVVGGWFVRVYVHVI